MHKEFLPLGLTVNKEYYLSVLRRLREAIRKKGRNYDDYSWLLHHDYAPAYTSMIVREFLAKNEGDEMIRGNGGVVRRVLFFGHNFWKKLYFLI